MVYAFGGFVSASVVISSMGLGAGVVAMVQPIHAPMASMAMNAMKTGTRTAQSLMVMPALASVVMPSIRLTSAGKKTTTAYRIATTTQTARIAPPIA